MSGRTVREVRYQRLKYQLFAITFALLAVVGLGVAIGELVVGAYAIAGVWLVVAVIAANFVPQSLSEMRR